MGIRSTTQRASVRVLARLALVFLAALVVWSAGSAASADAAAPRKLGKRVLQLGLKGTDVRVLQYSLTKLQRPVGVDGIYGPSTKHQVKLYEIQRHFRIDGVVQRGEGRKIHLATKKALQSTLGEVFPVQGPHSFGGPDNAFGAPRKGHVHQGQDVLAACGTKIVAVHAGYVRFNAFEAGGAGYYLVLHSSLSGQDHVYAHLMAPSWAVAGTPVYAGQQIGKVGATGDAVGCHLHFEIWTSPGWFKGGVPYDPLPSLLHWDSLS
jgi:murein DD-endopeptidase MepM/ murein hydrolase activator NlpD